MMTIIKIGTESWYVIEDLDVLLRRWRFAIRQCCFMPIRYAGVDRFVNPGQITYMLGCRTSADFR